MKDMYKRDDVEDAKDKASQIMSDLIYTKSAVDELTDAIDDLFAWQNNLNDSFDKLKTRLGG